MLLSEEYPEEFMYYIQREGKTPPFFVGRIQKEKHFVPDWENKIFLSFLAEVWYNQHK